MKRVICGVIILFGVFLYINQTNSNPIYAVELPNIWSGNTAITNEGDLSNQQVKKIQGCEPETINSAIIYGPVRVNSAGFPSFQQSDVGKSADKKSCITTNRQGAFSLNGYYSHDGLANRMLKIKPDDSGVTYHALPGGDAVLTMVYGRHGISMAINYNFSGIGHLGVQKKTFLKYEMTWTLINPATQIRYKNNQNVYFNGLAFSNNGKFIVTRIGTVFVKINVDTQEMTPFYYRSSIPNTASMAISNDGRYVATASNSEMLIHDTSGCTASYARGQWERPQNAYNYDGCTKSNNNYSRIYNKASSLDLKYGYIQNLDFSPNGSKITMAVGREFRNNSYDWKLIKMVASDYLSNVEGYLAMGDSYSSGEGDTQGGTWYEPGTDEQGDKNTFAGRNLCHLSRRSYPYLIAMDLGYLKTNLSSPLANGLFHSVACSGAKIHNIEGVLGDFQGDGGADKFSITDNQFRYDSKNNLMSWQPGFTKQTRFMKDFITDNGIKHTALVPSVITLGVGGNDGGFGSVLTQCLAPGTCDFAKAGSEDASRLAIRILGQKPRLISTYLKIKGASPESRIYVHGYPLFITASGNSCANNVPLNTTERQLIRESIHLMNQTIKASATEAGVFYVDVEDIMTGVNLCSGVKKENIVMNGATMGNDKYLLKEDGLLILGRGFCLTECIGNESFHPNPKGQRLYSGAIINQTDNLTAKMPLPKITKYPIPNIFFGSTAINYVNELNNNTVYPKLIITNEKFISSTQKYKKIRIKIKNFLPGSSAKATIYSSPMVLGTYRIDGSGLLDIELDLPASLPAGYHEIHIDGINTYGADIEYSQSFLTAVSTNDFDGDGIDNSKDSCPTIFNTFKDLDNDGVDDACDGVDNPIITIPKEVDATLYNKPSPAVNVLVLPAVAGVSTAKITTIATKNSTNIVIDNHPQQPQLVAVAPQGITGQQAMVLSDSTVISSKTAKPAIDAIYKNNSSSSSRLTYIIIAMFTLSLATVSYLYIKKTTKTL